MKPPTAHAFEFTPDTLQAWCGERGLPGYRAKQILEWVYRRGVIDPAAMTNLGKRDRELLSREMTFLSGRTIAEQAASDGTRKLLVEWEDGTEASAAGGVRLDVLGMSGGERTDRQTECVMIPAWSGGDERGEGARLRRTACISSQVGCPVGCKFCASGLGGLDANLSAGRIIEQVWRLDQLVKLREGGDARISNIVFMGMGEPLANFRAVEHAVRTIAAPWGMGIGGRRITISTVGLPKPIERLAERLDIPVTLALSLHAPNDELRRQLIPWADYTTIAELMAACRKWFGKTGREITLEYTLLGGVNDRPEHAAELAGVARQLRANINLIRFNEVGGVPYRRPQDRDVLEFQSILRARGHNAHIRVSRGRDIAAACGQLRHEKATAS
ncbi:MAG: 23S rRNA (adenine(2503)-C(2))-methyltransferase RlmN [Planctomycetota bacterium]